VISFVAETGQGGRVAFRYNTIVNAGRNGMEIFDAHGDQGDRGTVGVEYYKNTIQIATNARFMFHRGGQAIIANNTVSGGYSAGFNITEYSGWSYCTSSGYPKRDQINDSFYWNNMNGSGTISPTYTCNSTSCSNCNQYDSMFIQLNRDYWLPAKGADSAKPSSCTENSYYGTTDTGKIYRCSGGAWIQHYAPYTYPHPLRGGVVPPTGIQPPANLKILS